MYKGWLIYNLEDYKKNKVYAKMLIDYAEESGIELILYIREELVMGIQRDELVVYHQGKRLRVPDFVINRSRDYQLAKHMEYMEVRVFNSSQVTEIANDKGMTHQYVNRLGVTSMSTLLFDKAYMRIEQITMNYPLVIKSVNGHGGEEVYKVEDVGQAKEIISMLKGDKLLVQEVCSQVGVDVRVFVIGNQIIGAIRRESQNDFRSNYSLGGKALVYELSLEERKIVEKILLHLRCDFVGIDFMIDREGKFIFNEIEDAVGSRTLYAYTSVDSARLYIEHIIKEIDEKI